MARIEQTFRSLRDKGEKALIAFVTAGDPPLDDLPYILDALSEGGADIIEVGLPYSDPIADGPVIQSASQRALDRGLKIGDVLKVLRDFEGPPCIIMGYMNTILARGLDRFVLEAFDSGVSGMIVCDLTPESATEYLVAARHRGLDTVFLVAPTSTDARLDVVSEVSSGFIYAVSRTGVTGQSQSDSDDLGLIERVRSRSQLPVCVGFGIDSPSRVAQVCQTADGAIVGSLLVSLIHETWQGGKGRATLVQAVRDLKSATKCTEK